MPPRKNKKAPAAESKTPAAVASAGAGSKPEANLKEKGNKAFETGDFRGALDLYTRAIEQDGKAHALYSNRSATYYALKKYNEALADAQQCVSLAPTWAKGYFRKGQAEEALLLYPEAYQSFLAGLKQDAAEANCLKAAEEMKKLLDELQITSREAVEGENPDQDKFENMIKWLKDNGAQFPKLYMKYYTEDYRGVHAITKIPVDDIILLVPLKCIMTSEVAKASDICKRIISAGVDIRSKHSYLAAYLLQEKALGKKSFWEPYMRILPQKYANMPVFFEDDMLQNELKGSMSLQKISDRIDSLRREYDNIRRHVPEFGKFTLDEFIWARFVVITRIFGLVIEGNKTDGLVPYADMLNHKKPSSETGAARNDEADTKWTYEDSRGGFTITTTHPISRGDQIFDSYGRKCNSRFFVNYGFSLDDNEDNEAVIRVHLPSSDAHFMTKLRMLGGREHSARREFQIPGVYGHKKVKELFSFMRFIHAQGSELMFLNAGAGFKLDEIGPISVANEIKVLEDIRQASKVSLSAFPTSLEEDEKLMAAAEPFSNLRNCIVMRHGEKTVLRFFVDLADRAIPLLNMPWKDLKRIAKKSEGARNNGFDLYVTMAVAPLVRDRKA